MIPGFWRNRADPVMRRVSARLNATGLTVCTMDNRGHGESGGTFGFNTHECEDVIRTLEMLEKQRISSRRACLMGFSAGAAIALSAASIRPDLVRGLVLVSPVADFKRVIPRPNPFRPGKQVSLQRILRPPRFWWYERTRRNTLDDARRVTVPVCLIHARHDWLVHHSHSERIAARLPSRPELRLMDLDRAHAERLLDREGTPWDVVFDYMSRSLGMTLSGA